MCKTLAVSFTHPGTSFSHSDISLVWEMFHKQMQLHHWRANHLGSSRTLRRSQGPPVLGCAALLKEGGGEERRGEEGGGREGGRDGQQAGGEQHYLITTAPSAKRQAARGN